MTVAEKHPVGSAHRRLLAKGLNATMELQEWTPTIVGTSAAGAGTYTGQQGYFQKIGHLILVKGYLKWTAHTGTGDMVIGGLPALSDDLTDSVSPIALNTDNLAISANKTAQAYIIANSQIITLIQVPTGGGAIAAIPIDSAATVIFSGWYTVKPN
jgi:hypothetical protein